MKKENFKIQIIEQLHQILGEREAEAQKTIAEIILSRDADSKSSAGDKHETSRAMAQIELDKNEVQLQKIKNLKSELLQINPQAQHQKIETGSLVFTNCENYFFSIGYGKIFLGEQVFYAISLGSPIGKALQEKLKGDKILFQEREIEILEIY